MRRASLAAAAGVILVAAGACSPSTAEAPVPGQQASPSAQPAPASPSPPVAAQPAAPSTVTVTFTGLPSGTYPAHVHSRCSVSQAYHLVVLSNLVVGAGGRGSVQVPASYAGRGFCVIVYSSAALSAVLDTHPV